MGPQRLSKLFSPPVSLSLCLLRPIRRCVAGLARTASVLVTTKCANESRCRPNDKAPGGSLSLPNTAAWVCWQTPSTARRVTTARSHCATAEVVSIMILRAAAAPCSTADGERRLASYRRCRFRRPASDAPIPCGPPTTTPTPAYVRPVCFPPGHGEYLLRTDRPYG